LQERSSPSLLRMISDKLDDEVFSCSHCQRVQS